MFDESAKISLLLSERIESLDAERDTLIARLKEEKPRKYPLRSLREIILLHACTIESNALTALAEANVPLLLLNGRGEYSASLYPGPIKNFYPRQAQFDAYRDPTRRLEIARRIVAVKLDSFRRIARERDDVYDPATEDASLAAAASLDEVRGLEGSATREHYSRMSKWLRGGEFVFVERTKRPPRDPVNALLSLSYTLTMNTTLTDMPCQGRQVWRLLGMFEPVVELLPAQPQF